MYAVGRLGSYITQGVYIVSGPFHPFGGAVDMVVVQQQDGSLKSSPWYVRFGKFQGVLKAKERIVDINVNGIDADFHMYLDPRGEAYFLREIDPEEIIESVSSHSSFSNGKNGKSHPVKSKIMNYEFDQCSPVSDVSNGAVISRNNSKRSRILGFVLGRRSMKEHSLLKEENGPDGEITGGRLEGSIVLHEQHFVNKPDNDENCVSEEMSEPKFDDSDEPEVGLITGQGSLEIVPESYAENGYDSNQEDTSLQDISCSSAVTIPLSQTETYEIRPHLESNGVLVQKVSEKLIFGDIDGSKPSIRKIEQEVNGAGVESRGKINGPDSLTVKTTVDRLKGDVGSIRRSPSFVEISKPRNCEITKPGIGRQAKSLPNMWSRFDDPVADDIEELQFYSPVGKFRSHHWDMLRENASRIKNANLEKEIAKSINNSSNGLKDGSIASGGSPDIVDGAGGRWSLWPFRRSGSKNIPEKEENIVMESEVDCSPKLDKMHRRALTPTSEQLASLNLLEGKNTVTFTFSTSVLGPQKVDARIYLWRWDTRIVISDVDGTITKSDVLGQFMPLVGRDWSHIGVTHLFSGIKENGYQMLYLSARAVSQASITRQFLFNLKQDGKALPDGPVVISPDGLFPSLFREVIRRTPHEFKIACLEDIKACFPSDRNPFYAGFGNRVTDEFSYLKVGIPKGKIFIINPKGEVVINRCIDSKSYASLHALVNGIFPPISVHEEREDYNSWNYWKLPPPTIMIM